MLPAAVVAILQKFLPAIANSHTVFEMPEGQWEVVGRGNKKDKPVSNGKSKAKEDKRKLLENGPKLEDILPPSQIKSLFAAMEAEEKKPKEKKEKKESEPKKQAAKKQTAEKKPEPPKPKQHNSVEACLQAIDVNELVNLINTNKTRYVNAPLVWLKEIATYLNGRTQVDVGDAIFASQPATYPLSLLPADVRRSVEAVLREAGPQNTQLFYDSSLAALANDMTRGQSAIGHKVLLQMMAHENPELCVSSVAKYASLCKSYVNRPPVGLSVLWALGQGGVRNLVVGLQVWQELILPLVELRHYSKFVSAYLTKLLDRHNKMDASKLTQEQFLALFDLIGAKRNGLAKDITSDLIKQLVKVRKIYFTRTSGKLQVTFNQLLKKLPIQYIASNNLDAFQLELVDTLVECLQRDDTCNATWRQLYQKCPKQSATLLNYIDTNWSTVSPRLSLSTLQTTLLYFREQSADARKGEVALTVDKMCQEMGKKMKKSSRRFPWLFAILATLAGIAGLLAYDVTQAGGVFSRSATGKFLKEAGVLEQTEHAWRRALAASARSYVWVEANAPVYYETAAVYSRPYAELARDFYLIAANQAGTMFNNTREYVAEKAPQVGATVEQYVPGLLGTVRDYSVATRDAVHRFSSVYYNSGREYLGSKVFIGDWAPEVLQDRTLKALNSTRNYVTDYYDWFHKQVHLYSEIQ